MDEHLEIGELCDIKINGVSLSAEIKANLIQQIRSRGIGICNSCMLLDVPRVPRPSTRGKEIIPGNDIDSSRMRYSGEYTLHEAYINHIECCPREYELIANTPGDDIMHMILECIAECSAYYVCQHNELTKNIILCNKCEGIVTPICDKCMEPEKSICAECLNEESMLLIASGIDDINV